jgi:hypothetical protein
MMATVGELIYTQLAADSGVSTLVGTRIYPRRLPQSPSVPAITYQRISSSPQMGTTALRRSRYQLNCWDLTDDGVQALADAAKSAMEEYTDTDQTPGIKMAEVINEIDTTDDETDMRRVIVDVMLTTTGD